MGYKGDRTTGFASPAEDSVEGPLDLAATLNLRAPSCYPVRVAGTALSARMIQEGDILIADAAVLPAAGKLAVIMVGGEVLIGSLARRDGKWFLDPGRSGEKSLQVADDDTAEIWGIVTALIRTDV